MLILILMGRALNFIPNLFYQVFYRKKVGGFVTCGRRVQDMETRHKNASRGMLWDGAAKRRVFMGFGLFRGFHRLLRGCGVAKR